MRENRFQRVLSEGRGPVGHMVMEFGTRGIPRILEAAGVDFAVFDMEHSAFDVDRMADILSWCHGTSFAPFVRVPQGRYHFLARVLDAGALGVMVANVETEAQAKEIVDAVKYAPLGHRGLGLGTAHNDYVMPSPVDYLKTANERTTVICQIESPTGVANAERIAAVPGVDVLWVGHFDLTSGMGILGQFEHPDFLAALDAVVKAAQSQGKLAGIQPGSLEQARSWSARGYRVLSYSADIGVYRAALQSGVEAFRRSL